MKTITPSADEHLIEAARKQAHKDNTTLEELFHLWLEDYVERKKRADAAMQTIDELSGRISTGGRKFTRDEMNER